MQVIKKHWMGFDTIILHNRIINGCQDFHVNDAEEIAEQYSVSKEVMNEVVSLAKSEVDDNFDYFIGSSNSKVRAVVAQYGNDEQRDKLIFDHHFDVLHNLATYGSDDHRWHLKNHPDWLIRGACAINGNHAIQCILANDKQVIVKRAVAENCDDSLLDYFKNDPEMGPILDDIIKNRKSKT